MKSLVRIIALAVALSVIAPVPSQAIYSGTSATGSPYVLTLLTSKDSRTSFCSMALVTDRIVATAAHCVIEDQGKAPNLRWPIQNIYVSLPGADVSRDDVSSRVKVLRVVTKDTFINTWKPEVGDMRTQVDDIAFLFLEKALVSGYSIPVATDAEINAAVAAGKSIEHFGYGLQTSTTQTHSPWTTQLPLIYSNFAHLDNSKVMFVREGPSALCPGDSGGPWYINVDGVRKIAGVTVAASGCRGNPPYTGGALGTRIAPYLDLMNSSWKQFLVDEPVLRQTILGEEEALEKKRVEAIAAGTYLLSAGCHAKGIGAELQYLDEKKNWISLGAASGWIQADVSCPSSNPVRPWISVEFSGTRTLRWRYWSSTWSVYGDLFTLTRNGSIPTPTPTPTITGGTAVSVDRKPTTPTSTSQPRPTPRPSVVISSGGSTSGGTTSGSTNSARKTITCVKKGLPTRKVVGPNPKCPPGYTKKP